MSCLLGCADMTREELEGILTEIVRRLRDALSPETIYLYGSCVHGSLHAGSDIDVLVIVRESESGFFERGALAYRALRRIGAPVDVQVYTRDEFDTRASLPVSFERTVRAKGRVLYAA